MRIKYAQRGTNVTLDVMLDIEMLMKFAPASVAIALASIVLPVPGGPNSRIPLQGCAKGNSKSEIRMGNILTKGLLDNHEIFLLLNFINCTV